MAVCSEIHTKHINTLCGQNVGFLDVNSGGKKSNHWALNFLCSQMIHIYGRCIFWLQASDLSFGFALQEPTNYLQLFRQFLHNFPHQFGQRVT